MGPLFRSDRIRAAAATEAPPGPVTMLAGLRASRPPNTVRFQKPMNGGPIDRVNDHAAGPSSGIAPRVLGSVMRLDQSQFRVSPVACVELTIARILQSE